MMVLLKIFIFFTLLCACQFGGLVKGQKDAAHIVPDASVIASTARKWQRYYQNDPSSYDLTLTSKNIAPEDLISDSDLTVKIFKSKDRTSSPLVLDVEIDNHDPDEFFLYMMTKDGYEICALDLSAYDDNHQQSLCSANESLFHFGDNAFVISVYSRTTKRLLLQTTSHLFFTAKEYDEVILQRKKMFDYVLLPIIEQQKTIALAGTLMLLAFFLSKNMNFPQREILLQDGSTNDYGGDNDGGSGNGGGRGFTSTNTFRDGRLDYYQPHPAEGLSAPASKAVSSPVKPPTVDFEILGHSKQSFRTNEPKKDIIAFTTTKARQSDGVMRRISRSLASLRHNRRLTWTIIGLTLATSFAILRLTDPSATSGALRDPSLMNDISESIFGKFQISRKKRLGHGRSNPQSRNEDQHTLHEESPSHQTGYHPFNSNQNVDVIESRQPVNWNRHLPNKLQKQAAIDELDLILFKPTRITSSPSIGKRS
jgi:hypothetical protein